MRMQTLGIILTVMAMIGGVVSIFTFEVFPAKMAVAVAIVAMVGWALIVLDPFYRKVS